MIIPLEDQQRIVNQHLDAAFDELVDRLHSQRAFIYGLALERLAVGVEEYGDAIFHRSPDQLEREVLEELADSVNYVAAILYRDRGE